MWVQIVKRNGQITVPKPLRDKFGIEDGGYVGVEEVDGKIVIKVISVEEKNGE